MVPAGVLYVYFMVLYLLVLLLATTHREMVRAWKEFSWKVRGLSTTARGGYTNNSRAVWGKFEESAHTINNIADEPVHRPPRAWETKTPQYDGN